MRLSEAKDIINGRYANMDDVEFANISIDTRTISKGDLYIALKGENFDGHNFLEQAQQAGAFAAVVEKKIDHPLPQIIVEDCRIALGLLAKAKRQAMPVKVVGITGSNGKTTVKEMLAAILSQDNAVLYTHGNLNNDIGVPLTLLRLEPKHHFAVIEMGANHPGEIGYTANLALPDVSILNNVGPAHIEGFGSVEGVAEAKGEIITALTDQGTAVLNADDAFFDYWMDLKAKRKVITFGLNSTADISADNIQYAIKDGVFRTTFNLHYAGKSIALLLNLAGRHNVANAMAAAAAAFALQIPEQAIAAGLQSMQPVTGRLQPLISRYGNIVIDDTYNANPASLAAALNVLCDCPGEPWVILGAFGEMGEDSENIHRDIGKLVHAMGIKHFYATGADARHAINAFGVGGRFFESQQALIDLLQTRLSGNECLLVKGSRLQKMENVVASIVENHRK